jgi:Domain of unknown function (DUF4279)
VAVDRSKAALRISSDLGSAAAVTSLLGVEPTNSHEIGDARSNRNPGTWRHSHWALESTLAEEEPLGTHLEQLLDVVEAKRSEIQSLKNDGYSLDWFCFVSIEDGQGGVMLAPTLLARLAHFGVSLDLDLYG